MNKSQLPRWRSYGDYSSENYGAHSIEMTIKGMTLYFSYQTVVAFRNARGYELVISKNVWGTTTGRHLNWINPDHKIRIENKEFEKKLQEVIDRL